MITFELTPKRPYDRFNSELELRSSHTTAETWLRQSRLLLRLGIAQRWIGPSKTLSRAPRYTWSMEGVAFLSCSRNTGCCDHCQPRSYRMGHCDTCCGLRRS